LAESTIVGRERELARLSGAIDDAAEGRGSVWYLTGEPGIGKSALAEEVARLARERGMRTFWGRCWEAGGAPAYWPWVQVLRAVLRTSEPGQLDAYLGTLSQILPEVPADPSMPEAEDLGAEQARFQLMDAVSNVLADAAQRLPLVVVLEDLHVADVSTVLLLEFLAVTARHQPLLILGTFREAELGRAAAGAQLTTAAQQGQRISLERLTEPDVAAFLRASGETAEASFVGALHRTTDGHPLFLVEVARLWRAQGRTDPATRTSIPRSVRTAIQERLTTVSSSCIETLQRGAVVGREFDIGLLEACHGESNYVEAAQEATDAAILTEVAPQRYRFVHFLIRELVYESLSESERADAHARLAEILVSRPRHGEPRWSEIAHHLLSASKDIDATRAFRAAGAQALHQLAFDEAVRAYEDALRTADETAEIDTQATMELLLELGHAQTRAGLVAEGKATCMRAAELARKEGDSEMLARAALEHGTQLIYARVDAELIALLEEALHALGPADSTLVARVMARLAAAQQPAEDPEGPMQLARDAISMARRLGDRETLLDTLRNGGSAMVDLGDLEERILLDREHAVLAEELNNPVEALRGNLRSIMDYLELERLDDAFRAMRACERIAESLNHPTYAWRPIAIRALRALWEGRLDTAEALIEEVGSLGVRGADLNAEVVYTMQKTRLLQYRGDLEAQRPLLSELDRHWEATEMGKTTANLITGAEHVLAGRTEEGLRGFDSAAVRKILRLGDHTLRLSVARLAVAAQDRELGEELYRRLLVGREHLVTGGILYMTLEGPTSWGLAMITRFLGRGEDASEHYAHALEVTQRTGGRPAHALIALEYAEHLSEQTDGQTSARALGLARVAEQIAIEVGMPLLQSSARALVDALASDDDEPLPAEPEPQSLSMTQTGDSWVVSYGNVEFHLKDVRGVRLLARLVNEPGREFHVLDLGAARRTETGVFDRGDSGEVIDDEARRRYRARVIELREELEEAESWNDPGRAERAREELEMIERELSHAVGLGGRQRRSGSAAERARVNVQRRIRDAIRRIESYHPGLAKHLDRSVRTGAYCAYDP
jgi:predicted ATPase